MVISFTQRMLYIFVAAVACFSLTQPLCAQQREQEESAVQDAYKAYIQAWKTRDVAALQKIIADDYMAVNFENKVSSKEIEIATAKSDPVWNQMTVDEIHTHIVGTTAVASGFIAAQGQRPDGSVFNAKVRFLAVLVKRDGRWQLLATESAAVKQQPS
jgi:ketosteroid isomerase-like protein